MFWKMFQSQVLDGVPAIVVFLESGPTFSVTFQQSQVVDNFPTVSCFKMWCNYCRFQKVCRQDRANIMQLIIPLLCSLVFLIASTHSKEPHLYALTVGNSFWDMLGSQSFIKQENLVRVIREVNIDKLLEENVVTFLNHDLIPAILSGFLLLPNLGVALFQHPT